MAASDPVAVELRLDRIDGVLARELPLHVRALATSYLRGEPAPPAPALVHRPETLAAARAALAHPGLADRGRALLRLVAPIAIEREVALAHALPPTWATLAVLAQARDAAAMARLGRRALEVIHALHGSAAPSARGVVVGQVGHVAEAALPPAIPAWSQPDGVVVDEAALPPAIPAWSQPDGVVVDEAAIARVWDALRAEHGVAGSVRFERANVRPRCFVVVPGAEVIVVIPVQIVTPADRFAVLHELGHAIAALGVPAGVPRAVDEAAAAYVARAIEGGHPWHSELAIAARGRRLALARRLDRIERALPALPAVDDRPAERPPWALWHDPGAQAAYVAAEAIADELTWATTGQGGLVRALAAQRAAVDRLDL